MSGDKFHRVLSTLETYSVIYTNLNRNPTQGTSQARDQLEQTITELTNHLFTNHKGAF